MTGEGKVVLVTGANGAGKFVTPAFLNAAATVTGSSRKIRQNEFEGANFIALPADLPSREGAKALLDEVVMRFCALDVLVRTVSGFAGGQSVTDTDDATFQRMLNMNLILHFTSFVRHYQHCVGREAVASSQLAAASQRSPEQESAAYSASKAAMLSLTKTVAVEN
jgi:NAD(P)-dependent dehydrogenase (short-subunit alcohol dehydrogenase family)